MWCTTKHINDVVVGVRKAGHSVRKTPKVTKVLSPITAANLRQAHQLVETGHMRGKVVVMNN
ncbi:hypothetical protein FC34_GL001080 [Lacticaseibacillus brantae DSM 23927]|uniref:Uncharacterized protein n=1 Tax=Lacticaseibacillus brantae DSM 23927 TaxID=1423727 RepID=A0A0R2AYK6_9LACO|nr:hypothetical protein FC34_GL001080 [Lacticaseibacillus brantae DSM 23927]